MARILIIEDNPDLCLNLCEFLERGGHAMDAAPDGVTGLHLATVNDYDLIVLDLSLPGIDGLAVCDRLRKVARKAVPVLMLTGRDTLNDKLEGFAAGADDYVVKPFELLELEARTRALLARARSIADARILHVGDLTFDLDTLEVARAGARIILSRAGLKLLELLMRETHRVVKREELERLLWDEDPPDSDVLRTHVHALRRVVDKPFSVPLIHTVHGIGYRLSDRGAR